MYLTTNPSGVYHGFGLYEGGLTAGGGGAGVKKNQPPITSTGIFADPFSTAMSGNQSGTLQPYINRMTQLGSNALYGGLLGYQPQSMIAGNAGGTPINSQVPQGFNIQSALQGMNQNGLLNFGNRSWMGAQNG